MTRLRTAVLLAALSLTLAACSGGLGISLRVPDFEIPAGNTLTTVCYARVDNDTTTSVAAARYTGTATFVQDGVGTGTATVQVFGRSSQPTATCVREGGADLRLSDPITLAAGEPTEVAIGDGDAGRTLANLVRAGDFWLGASIENFNVGAEPPRVEFTDGRITVAF